LIGFLPHAHPATPESDGRLLEKDGEDGNKHTAKSTIVGYWSLLQVDTAAAERSHLREYKYLQLPRLPYQVPVMKMVNFGTCHVK
jgi:hypothetical protein